MSRDFIFSVVLHVIIVAVLMFSPSLSLPDRSDFGEVIRVNAVTMPPAMMQPEVVPEVETPAPVVDEPDEIPISDPTTMPAAEIIKPKEEPKPPKPKAQPQQSTPQQDESESTGGTDVDAPAGSVFSGLQVDNAAFNYPFWFRLANHKIGQNYRVPFTVDGNVTCSVHFQVIKSGKVIEAEVVKKSPLPAYDAICLASIENASPFPPLPKEFLDEIIGLTVIFTLK